MRYFRMKRPRVDSHEARSSCQGSSDSSPKMLSLSSLPYEPLLEVLMDLEAEDVLSIRLVSRHLYETSETPLLWRKLLRELPATGHEPLIDSNFAPNIEELSLIDAKRIVLCTLSLARIWNAGDGSSDGSTDVSAGASRKEIVTQPRTRRKVKRTKARLGKCLSSDFVGPLLILDRYVLACGEQQLLCIDTGKERVVASYDNDVQAPSVVVYFNPLLRPCVVYVQLFGQSSENIVLHYVRLTIPDPSDSSSDPESDVPSFQYVHSYIIPSVWSISAGVIDIYTNSVYLLVRENPSYLEMTLVAIFDMLDGADKKDTCVMVKSGLEYEPKRFGDALLLAALESDRLILSCKTPGAKEGEIAHYKRISFSVTDLRPKASPVPLHPAEDYYTYPDVPRRQVEYPIQVPDRIPRSIIADVVYDAEYGFGGLGESEGLGEGVRRGGFRRAPICRIALSKNVNASVRDGWRLTQMYIPDDGSCTNTNPDPNPTPNPILTFFVEFENAVLSQADPYEILPVFDTSYNFAAWIEETEVKERFRRKAVKRRALKVVAFPLPTSSISSKERNLDEGDDKDMDAMGMTVTTLSGIKDSALRRATRIFIRPSLGSVFVLTRDRTLHRVAYF